MRVPTWRSAKRGLPAGIALLTAMAIIAAIGGRCAYTIIRGDTAGIRDAGAAARFPEHTVTYIARGQFFLVRESGAEFFAVAEQGPPQLGTNALDQCVARWYPLPSDVVEPSSTDPDLPAAFDPGAFAVGTVSDHGVFRETCEGSPYDVDGNRVSGPALIPLDRYPVRLLDGRVIVRHRGPDAHGIALADDAHGGRGRFRRVARRTAPGCSRPAMKSLN